MVSSPSRLVNLTACVTEKTIFAGRYRKGVAETEEENHLIVLMYVDDLLVVGDDRSIQKLVDELSKKLRLRLKVTKLEEDRIRFLGKVIEKEEDGTIALYMEKEYYEGIRMKGKSSDPQFVSAL